MDNYSSLKLCFWNVGGLISKTHDKTKDDLFLSQIKKFEVVFLAETHLGKDSDINIEDYHVHTICRSRSRHNSRYFGGLAILGKTRSKNMLRSFIMTTLKFNGLSLIKLSST